MNIETIKTPSLIVDSERVRRNAANITARAKSLNVRLRPHVKTHRSLEIAKLQIEGNFGGIMVSTLSEAHFFGDNGFRDITYGVPVERGKFDEVLAISRKLDKFAVLTADLETARGLNEAAMKADSRVGVYLKVDVGYHRAGVEPHTPEAVEIPRFIDSATNLDFEGILTHGGQSYHANTPENLLAIARQERDLMVGLADRLRSEGIEVANVSIGSTPAMSAIDNLDGVTEFRCGNYIFYDAFQATLGSCSFDDCALTVLAAVIHRDETRRRIVVDAGAVALSKDRGAVEFDENCGYGRVYDLEGNDLDLRVGSLSQEHGEILVGDNAAFDELRVGSRVRILANHSCLTALQHDAYHVLEDGRIVGNWQINRGW